MTLPTQEPLTAEELQHLAEIREVTTTVTTPGWFRILKKIEEYVAEAHEDMLGNVSADPMNALRLQLRWQQRESVLRGIRFYVNSCEEEKKLLLSESTEKGSVPPYAEQSGEVSGWESVS